MALITLEDLAELEEEDAVSAAPSNPEPMDEDEEQHNQLFAHWQSVANTHQVDLPREMMGPIQQLIRHNQVQEHVPYLPGTRFEKCNETAYEERLYPAGKWAYISRSEKLYEQSISMGFMKLMRYICSENSAGHHLGMTIPIINEIRIVTEGNCLTPEVVTAYYLPAVFQDQPPQPMDPDIEIVERQPMSVVTRVFFGTVNEEIILQEIQALTDLLGTTDAYSRDTYIIATYENPSVTQRRNEIWFIHTSQ
ncbi:heme-binding protein soul4 [Callorhinchus milii]|uniref:Heme-binding protein soul4 n=1 Tax=Callorhinchus milii TaxID=7868 RepID=A0A4W3KD77_CALMI|nr:heme-binding protein soul4 [Callorhinchus milii]XP_042189332.1 heme-binding protein soul4 [Callorhinchus milii]|eukprot:gi/632960862/ref/XP_007896438.1/ PREDICTED: heme-binding protein 1-like [Callorhinchus milii]